MRHGSGLAALLGVPGFVAPMDLETDALDYIDRDLPIYMDTRRFEQAISGLSAVQIWVTSPEGRVLDPAVLRGLEQFTRALEADPRVGSVIGPTTLLRWMSYVGGGGDRLPDDPAAWPALAARLDRLLGRAARAALSARPDLEEVSITFVPDEEIRELNRRYLDRDHATDVLAFDLGSHGDVYIAPEAARRAAAERGIPVAEELLRLVVHAALHLSGHDHPEDEGRDDSEMFRIQEALVARLRDGSA